jgi:hypothetical protein
MICIYSLDLYSGSGWLGLYSLVATGGIIIYLRFMAFVGRFIDRRVFILRTRKGCAQIYMSPLASVMKLNPEKVKKYKRILFKKLQKALRGNANKIIVNSHLLNSRRIDEIKKRLAADNRVLNLSYSVYQKNTRIIDEVTLVLIFFLTEWRVIKVGALSYIFEVRKV